MISYDLAGKTALVTGGASGIGLSTAAMLGRNGATVAVNFLADDSRGKDTVAKLKADGIKAVEAPGNVGDAADCARMVGKALREAIAADETVVVDVVTDIDARAPTPWLPEGAA